MSYTEAREINYWLKFMIAVMASGILANGIMLYTMRADLAVQQNIDSYMARDIAKIEIKLTKLEE